MTTDKTFQQHLDCKNMESLLHYALEEDSLKTLSLTEPWATLVAVGAKHQETRTWHPHHVGIIAIHSSRGFTGKDEAYCYRDHFRQTLEAAGYTTNKEKRSRQQQWSFAFGHIIAIARLSDAYQLAPLVFKSDLPPEPERSFGNYNGGRYIWLLPHVYRLKTPIPARGHQLLWSWTPTEEFRDEIREALAEQQNVS